jgi:LAO/AO transport system kinase
VNPRSPEALAAGILRGERLALARGITLIESERPEDWPRAEELLSRLLERGDLAVRIGISGVPGAGKSSLVETLGLHLVERCGRRVAVLAIDPSSTISGGSLLGDKSRMHLLAQHPLAYVRPSPNAAHLGGVARRTREAALLCSAAGFDLLLIETVGVGQSEIEVAGMVDFFLVLALAGAGDELQGIKRGIFELADVLAVNKADGPNRSAAEAYAAMLAGALHTLRPLEDPPPHVAAISAHTGQGVAELWSEIEARLAARRAAGRFEERRRDQRRIWFQSEVGLALERALRRSPRTLSLRRELEDRVAAGQVTAGAAAQRLLEALFESR